jgi:serine/threonine protein kinase/Tfp pilus assembly protein PilF
MSSKKRFKAVTPGSSSKERAERLSLDTARRIDRICERFEESLRAAQSPKIEDYLSGSDVGSIEPSALLRELLALEIEYRVLRGERPTREQYVTRFPQLQQAVERVFQEASASQSDATPPFLINHPRYRVVRLIGSGGMGSVYLAEQRMLERAVALKVINRDLLSDERMVERFRSEAKAAAKLSHPNVVAVYDAETAGEGHFLVMEYVAGTDLARLVIDRGPLPVAAACDYIRQAALGLQHAHEHQMVHRDISPRNLMLTDQRCVKVLDFGLAYFATEVGGRPSTPWKFFRKRLRKAKRSLIGENTPSPPPLSASNFLLGSIDYMAPEQAISPQSADIRADVYSLGCTLFFLITGQPPFPHGMLVEKIEAHASQSPPSIDELRDDVPPELALVLARMLAKLPDDRYQTPAEVAAALAPLSGVPLLAPPQRRWRPNRRHWTFAAVTVLLIGAAISAWQMTHAPVAPDQPPTDAETPTARAQRLYREGILLLGQRRESQTNLAIRRLQSAVGLVRSYPLAYAALADAYNILGDYGWEKPSVVFPAAKEAAQKALTQDADLAEAHLALAFALDAYDGNTAAAEKEFRLALKLKPKLAAAHHWYAWFLAQQGRMKEATKEIEQAQKLGPDEVIIANNAGRIAFFQRDYPLAVKKHKYALELSPDFRKAHRDLAIVYAEMGQLDDALREAKAIKGLSDDGLDQPAVRAYAYARNGKPDKARSQLADLLPMADQKPLAYDIAAIYAALGDKDAAFKWLDRAFRERNASRTALAVDPRFDPLRKDPRFKTIGRK